MLVNRNSGKDRKMVSRSNSLIGTIKSILPSRLPWFGSQNDTPTKRKQVLEQVEEATDERSTKRQRVDESLGEGRRNSAGGHSRVVSASSGYLDPPETAFSQVPNGSVSRVPTVHMRASSAAAPTRRPASKSRATMSPSPRPQASRISRTQSMDPPSRFRAGTHVPTVGPVPMSRDVSMDDVAVLDASTSPSRPFRMRTSLTPQLSASSFGPAPARRDRDASEPPPLAALIDNPVFVRGPPPDEETAEKIPEQPVVTLGTITEARRGGKALQRNYSSLKIGTESGSMQDVQPTSGIYAINHTDKVIRQLEVYKTPLLPTRLQGSNTVPDMFRRRRPHAPLLMHDRERKPRLGSVDTIDETPPESPSKKPYAGSGGMKKLLAKRRAEAEAEQAKEQAARIQANKDQPESSRAAQAPMKKAVLELPAPPASPKADPPKSIGGREQSSLRVGRTRINRGHDAPVKSRAQVGRFSALYEEDEEPDEAARARERAELEEAAKKAPVFNIPANFTFANTTAPANAKAPMAKLPFSLSKPSVIPAEERTDKNPVLSLSEGLSNSGSAASPPVTVAAASIAVLAPAPLTPVLNTVPPIALIPPSPGQSGPTSAPSQPVAEQLGASDSGEVPASVPNFFSSSSIFSKVSQPVVTPPTFSLVPPAPAPAPAPAAAKSNERASVSSSSDQEHTAGLTKLSTAGFQVHGAASAVGEPCATKSTQEGLFGGSPSVPSPFSAFGPLSSSNSKVSESLIAKSPVPAPSAPSFAPLPVTNTIEVSKPEVKPTTAPAPASLFTFGQPAKTAETTTSSGSMFTFGVPPTPSLQSPEGSRPSTAEAVKPATPLFGTTPVAPQPVTPFAGFGASATAATPTPCKSPFTLGDSASPALSTSTTPALPEPAKPLFSTASTFTFGQPSTTATAPSAPTPTKSPFTFGTSPSTPTTDSKPFTFGSPATASGSTLFGTTVNSNPVESSNKPFGLAPTATIREMTPPKKDDSEVMMDESPTRAPIAETNRPELPKLNGGFNFNVTGSSSPFGQPGQNSSSGFAFGRSTESSNPFGPKIDTKVSEKPSTPFGGFGQTSTSTGFAFGGVKESTPAAPSPNFSFSPATPTATSASPFSFGAPQIAQSNSFGQPTSASGSAPASPSTFGQPTQPSGFAFGSTPTSTTAPSNPFNFTGSQPASPAAAHAGLPGQNGAGGFTFGASAAPASTPSPFGAPAPLPPAGGAIFTMGAPPPSTPTGNRPVRKLPTRRGGAPKR